MSDHSQPDGEVTPDELQQIRSADQITERTKNYLAPNYDSVADDTSYAESGPMV